MDSSKAIDWKELIVELEKAPKYFLQEASSLYRQRRSTRCREQAQQPREAVLGEARRKDADQQALWEAEYCSATDELWYFGEFKDKDEHVRLLQPVKVVRRTAKQIHIIAAYTMYCFKMSRDSEPALWSTSATGGLFSDIYTGWTPITRYRLRRIHKTRLFSPSALQIPPDGERFDKRDAHNDAWRLLCNICLFANEDEYAKWHLVRYEGTPQQEGRYRNEKAHRTHTHRARGTRQPPHVILGLERDASQPEITASYRRLAMRHHPDRGGDPSAFHIVKQAYEKMKASGSS
jgi:hypothetical protein